MRRLFTFTVRYMILVAMAGLCATLAYAEGERPTKGLVAYWSFDEIKGDRVLDLSGRANDVVVRSALHVKGVGKRGLHFDGITDCASSPNSPELSITDAITIEAWVKFDAVPPLSYATVVRKDRCYALRFNGARLGFIIWNGGRFVILSSRKEDWKPGRWYHLAATYDSSRMRLFIDGAEDDASPMKMKGLIDVAPSSVGIGAVGSRWRFRGTIDEVRLYNRALTPQEVRAAYAWGRTAMRKQATVAFAPKKIGRRIPARIFRKPKRNITMIKKGFIWIDAEDFADYGGWSLDTQFVHLMGSGYLIATGIGKPVKDATVAIEIPNASRYRLWVRAKNWLKDYSPGRFRVIVNGTPSGHVFGKAPTEEWIWESAGEFDLEEGQCRIALRDLTGYYSRCDALVLTTNMQYIPPARVEDIAKERSRLTGLSLEPKFVGDFDVIVVGAGAAGCCAAVASARMGAKTALIQNRPVLGGNASSELGVHICGAGSSHPNARESGIIEEAGRIHARYGYPKMSEPFRILAEKEKNLTVFLNRHVFAVDMKDKKRIAAVKAVDTLTNEITLYKGKMFIDCTGDGWVGYFADARYRLGREARDEFGESLAPERPDKITMSGCIMGQSLGYRAINVGKPSPYSPPPWAPKFPPAEEFGRKPRGFAGGQWWLEHPGDIDDLWNAEKARDELIRITFGYWDWIKNVSPFRKAATNYALAVVPIGDAKRESRRLVGDYTLTQNDVQRARVFPDRISYGGWPLDVHHPKGIFSGKEGPFDFDPHVPIYTVPFRILYSANIDNLLMAGRDVSVTHVALGTVRVQGTLATFGQAAGTAAAMCIKLSTTPRGIYQNYIKQLQQTLLKHDQYIPGVRNEDPNDLARYAIPVASSTMQYEEFTPDHIGRAELHPLNVPRAVMFPRGERDGFASISLLLQSDRDTPTEIVLHVREANNPGDFSSTKDIAVAKSTVRPKRESWTKFKVDCRTDAPYVWVWLPRTEGISWRLMNRAPAGSCRAYGEAWTVVKGQYYAFVTTPPVALRADYRVENITNGLTRVIDGASNMWASDPHTQMPQWVELRFREPVKFNTVYLTFDTDMNARWHTVPIVPECVRDYDLSYFDGEKWTRLVDVKGNFQRRRVHRFNTVIGEKLRLTVHATNGSKSARVFEIRVYEE